MIEKQLGKIAQKLGTSEVKLKDKINSGLRSAFSHEDSFSISVYYPKSQGLRFESSHWPWQFHHTGPFHDGRGRNKVDFPWERLTGQPLIYASIGTILNGRLDDFRTIVAALAKHKDLRLVLSVSDQIDPQQVRPAPSNAIIVKQAPQLRLRKRTSVCITHAGLNTMLGISDSGRPQVAIPVTYDQPLWPRESRTSKPVWSPR